MALQFWLDWLYNLSCYEYNKLTRYCLQNFIYIKNEFAQSQWREIIQQMHSIEYCMCCVHSASTFALERSLLCSSRQIGKCSEGLRNVEQLTYAKTVNLANKLAHGHFVTLFVWSDEQLLPLKAAPNRLWFYKDWMPLSSLPTCRPMHNRAILTRHSCSNPPPQLLSGGMHLQTWSSDSRGSKELGQTKMTASSNVWSSCGNLGIKRKC